MFPSHDQMKDQQLVGELLGELEGIDPKCYTQLNTIIEDWADLMRSQREKKEAQYKAIRKYFKTEKGKAARSRAGKKHYLKKKQMANQS